MDAPHSALVTNGLIIHDVPGVGGFLRFKLTTARLTHESLPTRNGDQWIITNLSHLVLEFWKAHLMVTDLKRSSSARNKTTQVIYYLFAGHHFELASSPVWVPYTLGKQCRTWSQNQNTTSWRRQLSFSRLLTKWNWHVVVITTTPCTACWEKSQVFTNPWWYLSTQHLVGVLPWFNQVLFFLYCLYK